MASSTAETELQHMAVESQDGSFQSSGMAPALDALPPTDSGYRAWLLLSGCFIINVLIWGFSFSFGVLQEYYKTHAPFNSNSNGIAAIGTTSTGLMYLLLPLYFALYQRWPCLKRWSTWMSLLVIPSGLIGASFANTVPQLIATQGVVFAIGGNMMFAPTVAYLDEWFVRRKGLAIGIMWAGDGTGGVLMPIILQHALSNYGFRWTLRGLAVAMVLLMAPLLMFIKPRIPVRPTTASATRPTDLGFLKTKLFWVLQICNVVQGTGYFLPPNYLPTFAQSIGLSPSLGSLTLVLMNAASTIGCIGVGTLVDRADVTTVLLGISVGATAAIIAVWGLSVSIAPLCVFSVFYGITAGSYSTAWTGMIKDMQRKSAGADANMVFGVLAAGRGLGAVISGPLSEALIGSSSSGDSDMLFEYGGPYRRLIIYAGCTALFGGFSWVLRLLRFI